MARLTKSTNPTCTRCGTPLEAGLRYCTACGQKSHIWGKPLHERLQDDLGPDYQVMGELGRGGFAMVYSVRDVPNQRYLAVKVMRPELMTSEVALERFRREAYFVAGLDHPNILAVVFVSAKEDLAYYGMPKVRGRSLSKVLKDGPLSVEQTMSILGDTARGLQHAHEQSFIHRDIKSSNVMIDENGKATLLDFGMAKALGGDNSLTETGEVIGTPAYMSPEQCRGAREVDHRSDMYSWGVLGYEMLAGKPPFVGKTPRHVMKDHIATPAPPVQAIRPDTPPPLAAAIDRCLQKEPANRFNSLREAATAAGIP